MNTGQIYTFQCQHEKLHKHKEARFYCEGDWTLQQVLQRGYGVSFLEVFKQILKTPSRYVPG